MGQAFWTGVRLPSSPPEVLSGHIHGLFFEKRKPLVRPGVQLSFSVESLI